MFNFITVQRCPPELVKPAAPTPHEVKLLSDIDDQQGLRFNIPFIFIYRHNPSMTKDSVKVLKHALSQTLVYYYPLAGRIKEGDGRKLMVDCTGEGVMFVEAEADVTLDELFGDAMQPPFPCFEELLHDVPDSELNIDRPIRLIQVTRLKCGGFILVLNWNHTMGDATGVKQFLNAWAEITQGAHKPSIQPLWNRELLMARDPPRITCSHREYEQLIPSPNTTTTTIVHQSFFFTPAHIDSIRRLVPLHLRQCTTFDLISACFWYCRTKALQLDPEEEVRFMCIVNARSRFSNCSSLVGYYGNIFAYPAVVTTVGKLCGNPFGYAVELIRKAKNQVTEEYMHSVTDFLVIKNRCLFTTVRSCIVSDLTRARFKEVNFGWNEAVYGGVVKGGAGPFHGVTYIVPHRNAKGEDGFMLPICLSSEDMNRFAEELDKMLKITQQ